MACALAAKGVRPRQRGLLESLWRARTSYLFLLPFLVLFMAFVVLPILASFYLSLTNFTAVKPPQFVGLQNYSRLFQDQRFIKALTNSLRYVFSVVSLNTLFALTLAVLLERPTPLNQFLRVIFFLPSVTSSVALNVLWRWVFIGEDYGLVNSILLRLGSSTITFLADPHWTMPILVIMAVWGGMGYAMVIFLAGLQAIPPELHEAAAIDGANERQRFWCITLPLLRPVLLYVLITGMISAFQVFEAVYIVFRSVESIGGVLDSGLTLVPYLYYQGFQRFKMGYASAIAWVLFVLIFALTLINLRVGRAGEAD